MTTKYFLLTYQNKNGHKFLVVDVKTNVHSDALNFVIEDLHYEKQEITKGAYDKYKGTSVLDHEDYKVNNIK